MPERTISPEEIKAAVEKLEVADFAFALSQLVLKQISGQKVEQKEYQVKVSIPTEIGIIFEKLAEVSEVPVEELIAGFTKVTFTKGIESKVKQHKKSTEPTPAVPTTEGIDEFMKGFGGGGLTEGLNKIKDLAETLNTMKDQVENAVNTSNQTDSKQPDVPAGQSTKQETKDR